MNIVQQNNKLFFDNVFSVDLPSGAVFEPETEESYASINNIQIAGNTDESFQVLIRCNDDTDNDYDLMDGIHSFLCENGMRCNVYYSQIASLFDIVMLMFRVRLKIQTIDIFMDFFMKFSITAFCSSDIIGSLESLEKIFESLRLISGGNSLSWNKISNSEIEQNLKEEFGIIEPEYERNLDGIVTEDFTRVVICNEWAITIPKGYIYSADDDKYRKIVFMKNDDTADFYDNYSASENFTCIFTEGNGRGGIVNSMYPCTLKNTEKLDVVYNCFDEPDDDGLLKILAGVLTDSGVYGIQIYFNGVSNDQNEIQSVIKKGLSWLQTITPADEVYDPKNAMELPDTILTEEVTQKKTDSDSYGNTSAGIPNFTAVNVKQVAKDGTALIPGQRIDCSDICGKSVEIRYTCSSDSSKYEMDSYTFLLDENEKVFNESDFIFFNQTYSENHAVQVDITKRYPHVNVQLDKLPDKYQKIAVCFSLYKNSAISVFGELQNSSIQLISDGKEIYHLDLNGLNKEGSIVALEFYRYKGAWKIRCIGQGYLDEMEKLCASYGVETV